MAGPFDAHAADTAGFIVTRVRSRWNDFTPDGPGAVGGAWWGWASASVADLDVLDHRHQLRHRHLDRLVAGDRHAVGLAAVVVSTHPSSLAVGVLVLYVLAALAIYGFSAIEAFRLAQGERPWLTTRQLLWAVVAIVIASF